MSDPYTSQTAPPPADRTVKVPHLVFGLLFLGVAGLWAIGESGAIRGSTLAILGPAVLIGAGLIGLVASLATGGNRRRQRRARELDADETTETTETPDTTQEQP